MKIVGILLMAICWLYGLQDNVSDHEMNESDNSTENNISHEVGNETRYAFFIRSPFGTHDNDDEGIVTQEFLFGISVGIVLSLVGGVARRRYLRQSLPQERYNKKLLQKFLPYLHLPSVKPLCDKLEENIYAHHHHKISRLEMKEALNAIKHEKKKETSHEKREY